jgi:hypothetical protein
VYPLVAALSGVQRDLAERALQKAFGGTKGISLRIIRKAVSTASPKPSSLADATAVDDEPSDEGAIPGPRLQPRPAAPRITLLDQPPPTFTRPLMLIDGQAYAATWLYTRTTITEKLGKDGEVVRLTEPVLHEE